MQGRSAKWTNELVMTNFETDAFDYVRSVEVDDEGYVTKVRMGSAVGISRFSMKRIYFVGEFLN